MRILTVLNQDGGTLKTTDLNAFGAHLRSEFEKAGHDFDLKITPGADIADALESAAADQHVDVILAGGGDGTISGAAAVAWKSGKALGVIPAGTMNLFARSIGVPLDIMQAASALAEGEVIPCDIATANGRPFVHQFSVGMQSRVVKDRNDQAYNSRIGKMLASARATLGMFAQPPSFKVQVTRDGEKEATETLSQIAVANNVYGEGHMPYADHLDGGVLGIYRAGILDTAASVKLTADLMIGAWRANPDFSESTAREVVLAFPHLKHSAHAVIDGELIKLAPEVVIKTHPGALNILVPKT